MSKVKEKAPMGKQLKEKVQAAPKELLRRGLSDGTQRLRGQFRDAAQRGQRDGYGGDQIEDTAWAGGRWAKRGIQKLLKQKKDGRAKETDHSTSRTLESPAEPPSWDILAPPDPPEGPAPQGGTERMRIKTREAVARADQVEVPESASPRIRSHSSVFQQRPSSPAPTTESPAAHELPIREKGPGRVQIKTKETVAQSGSAELPEFEHGQTKSQSGIFRSPSQTTDVPVLKNDSAHVRIKTRESSVDWHSGVASSDKKAVDVPSQNSHGIKTKGSHIHQESSIVEQSPQAFDQGRKLFQRKQTRKMAENRKGQQASAEIPSVPQASQDKPSAQRFSSGHRPLQSREASGFSTPRAKSGTNVESVSGGKRAAKAIHPDKAVRSGSKTVGRKAGQSVKTAEQTSKRIIKSADRGAKVVERTAKAIPQARRRAVQAVRATKKATATTTRGVAKASKEALRATVKAARMLAAALAAGGSVVTAVILVICLVGMLASSPFGIFFADSSSPGAASPSAAVVQLNNELSDYLAALQVGGSYDRVEITGQPPDWSDVFAVFAAKTAGSGTDVVTLDTARVDLLQAVFWDMTKITTAEETVDHPASGSTPAWSETVLNITITARTSDDMRVLYSFTDTQNQALDALLANGGMLASLSGDLTITSQDAKALLAALPSNLSPERRAVVETVCRLVGKVNYFWGGKSRVLGWDERWGQIKKVTAAGSSTSGTYLSFGLDCSGFVDWVFYNVSGGGYIIGHGGGARSQHTYCTAIAWDQAIPGDLVFYPGDSHVGIVGGRDESGNLLIIHCTYSKNNVVITGKSGFTAIARPNYYSE